MATTASMRKWNERSAVGLGLNIGVAVGLAVSANAFIFLVNPNQQTASPAYRLQPPGYVIGIVWVGLFILMGIARWLVIDTQERNTKSAQWVFFLVIFCASYPLYTLGLSSLVLGLAGNIATAILAVWVASRIGKKSVLAAAFVSAPAVWVIFASFLVLEQILGRSL